MEGGESPAVGFFRTRVEGDQSCMVKALLCPLNEAFNCWSKSLETLEKEQQKTSHICSKHSIGKLTWKS